MQGLYQLEIRNEPLETLETFWKQIDAGSEASEFARGLVAGVIEQRDEIDALITEAAQHWRLERLSTVDLCVLRVATLELLHRDVPTGVCIDEAIEIARRFSAGESAAFVNGVLDQIAIKLGVKTNYPGEAREDE